MADYAKQQQQKIKEATERLEAGIKDFFTNGSYQEYLKVMSRFHNYSYSNSVMIALQKPDATLLAGYSGWQKNFERHVLPGEHGIRIFAPAPVKTKIEQEKKDPETKLPVLDENGDPVMETVEIKTPRFKVVTVFDVSQTDGKPLPELDINELNGSVQDFQRMFEAIVRSSDVPVELEDIEGEAKGYFSTLENKIVIQKDMSESQTIKTALHELAHSRLHKIDTTLPPGKQPVAKDRNTKEVEAESVAYVVCQHFNIDTSDYSFGYVATWSENRELPELKSSLDTIRKASAGIINDLESHLAEIEIARDTEIDHAELPTEEPEKSILSEDQIKSLTFDRYKKQLEESSIPQIDSYLADFDRLYDEGQLDNLKPDPSTFIQDTPEHLASAINTFIESYDPYMSKEAPDIIAENIKTGNIGYLQEWLESISSEEPDFHLQAQQLLERISSLSPNTEKIPEISSIDIHQLAVDIDRYCHDYDTYEYRDAIDDSDTFIPKLEHDLSSPHRINSVKAYLQEMIDESNDPESIKEAFKLLDRMAKLPADPTITFYTAECMEFPTLGELHEHLTLKEALTYYELIPAERMNGLKGIGFELCDGSDYDGKYELMILGQVQTESINSIPHFRDSPLVQKAISDMEDALYIHSQQLSEPEEAAYEINGNYLYIQPASDYSWDYTYYNQFLNLVDGGQIGTEDTLFSQARTEILEMLNLTDAPLTEIPVEQLVQMLEEREQNLLSPIYPHDLSEARAKGELDAWRISHNATCTCARQFQLEYERAYENRKVPEFLQQMVDRYGMERCKIVIASTIQLSPKDGRYTPDMKQAAAQVSVPDTNSNPSYDRRMDYQLNCHPVTVNVAMRDLLRIEQEQIKTAAQNCQDNKEKTPKKRTSILSKLENNKSILASGNEKNDSQKLYKPQL